MKERLFPLAVCEDTYTTLAETCQLLNRECCYHVSRWRIRKTIPVYKHKHLVSIVNTLLGVTEGMLIPVLLMRRCGDQQQTG
jgi:hypothetical protein